MTDFTEPKDIRVPLPSPHFTEQCKACKEMFIRLPSNGICPDCAEKGVKPKPADPVVGDNDAVEDVQSDLGYGR